MGTGSGAGTKTEKGVEANEGAQDGNGDGSGDETETGTGVETRRRTQDGNGGRSGDGNESSRGDGNGDEDGNGKEDRIGESAGAAKKRKKPYKSCRRHVGNGGDLGGMRKDVETKGLV